MAQMRMRQSMAQIELAFEQEMAGTDFATGSDCEPPLHLYLRYGPECINRLRGMYATAIHDMAAERLLLARDPFGIKPLYYAETETEDDIQFKGSDPLKVLFPKILGIFAFFSYLQVNTSARGNSFPMFTILSEGMWTRVFL